MDALTTLESLVGLAFLSGIRLYSTVFAVGLGIRTGFLDVPERLSQLEVLASTPILFIAGAVYLVEFLADKIPWVDSAWDLVHTVIRPLGAAILGVTAIGAVDPVVQIGAFLLCGTIALSSHSAKAGTRLAANHSPEPISNIGLSLGEDALVFTGTWLVFNHPLVAAIIVLVLVLLILWLIPKLFRLFRRNFARLMTVIKGGPTPSETA
ncbi:MAG TPA: DUF4126 domain-containing protein [Longimicrobiales bacterium]